MCYLALCSRFAPEGSRSYAAQQRSPVAGTGQLCPASGSGGWVGWDRAYGKRELCPIFAIYLMVRQTLPTDIVISSPLIRARSSDACGGG